MLGFIKRIIQRMLDFYRRVWRAFFVATPVWVGVAYVSKDSLVAFIILLIIAFICFVVALIGLYFDYQDGRRKARETKAAKDYDALKESFRRAHPEWTDEQVEIATRGY